MLTSELLRQPHCSFKFFFSNTVLNLKSGTAIQLLVVCTCIHETLSVFTTVLEERGTWRYWCCTSYFLPEYRMRGKRTIFCTTRIYEHVCRNGRECQISSLISVRRWYFKTLSTNSVNLLYEELNWSASYKKVCSYLTQNAYHFHFEHQSFSAVHGSSRRFENIMKYDKKCVDIRTNL